MDFEKGVLTQVTKARANAVAAGSQGPAAQAQAENALTGALRSLFAVVENYPTAQGQRERAVAAGAADHDREPDLVLPPALQRHRPGVQQLAPGLPERPDRRARWASRSASSSRPSRRPPRSPSSTWVVHLGSELGRAADRGAASPPEAASVTTTTFYSEESANRRKSFLLALVVIAFLAAFGFVIGYSIGYGSGDEVAFGIGALVIAVGIGTRQRPVLLLRRRQARAGELARPGGQRATGPGSCTTSSTRWRSRPACRCPRSTSSTTPRPTPSRPAATPSTLRWP